MDAIKQRFERLSTGFKVAIVGAGILLAAPLVGLVFAGLMSAIGLLIGAVIVSAAIAFAPAWAMKLANWRMQAVKAEASANPIETMQVLYTEKMQALGGFAGQIEKFAAKIENTRSQLARLRQKYPAEAQVFEEHLAKMEQLKVNRWAQYKRAERELARFRDEIDKAEAIWAMAQAAKSLDEAAGMGSNVLDEIKAKTAVIAVETSMNEAVAQLERMMQERIEEPGLIAEAPVKFGFGATEAVPILTDKVRS